MKNFIWVAILATGMAHADWSAETHLASKHFIASPESLGGFNEQNYGFGVEYHFDQWRVAVGVYRNSLGSHELECGTRNGFDACWWQAKPQNSVYLSAGRSLLSAGRIEFGAEAGIANGYAGWNSDKGFRYDNRSDYLLMIGPYVRIGDRYAVKLRYMIVVASLSLQYGF